MATQVDITRCTVESYIDEIASGKIPANLALHGWATETQARVAGWNWERLADYADFVSGVVQAAGSSAGKPLVLLPWQWTVAAQVIADPDCKVLLVTVARGAGKTELAATLLAWAIIRGGPQQHYHAVAPTLRTASIVYDRLRVMVHRMDPTATYSETTAISHQGGWIRTEHGSTMRALPCTETAMDGLSARLIVADEVARMEKGLGRLITGLSKDDKAQLLAITTPDSRQRSRAIWPYWSALHSHYTSGSDAPAGWRGMFYGLDIDDEALDSECWLKAQPSLGHTVSAGSMRASIESMMGTHDPEQTAECDMQVLCRHNDRLSGALDLAILDRQMTATEWESLRGAPAVIAVDLARGAQISSHANLSSLCLAVWDRHQSRFRMKLVHWWAGQNIEGDEARCHQPLRRWVAEGHLREMPGEIHDMGVIESQIHAFMAEYKVRHCGVDPLAHQESAIVDWRRRGITVTAVEQGIRTMAPAWALWTDGLRARTITHDPDPVLRACLSATRTISDNVGNIRPVKGRSAGNIDAVVAACMAALLCERFQVAKGSSYESGKVVL